MPNFPIVDAHVHLWDPRHFRMAWTDGNATLGRPFGLADYREHTTGVEVGAFVYVEVDVAPHYALLEAQWAEQRAQEEPRLRGIVAHAPVEYGEQARAFLAALAATGPHIKGVRRLLQGEADPAFCLRPGFVRGVQLLPEFGFSFDICIRHHQLASAVELVRQCPEVNFILDHIAKPDIAGGLLDPWREQMRAMAALPNVACKVSGMVTEAGGERWTADDLAPYVAHVLEVFGEERALFGGDWPVVLMASSYVRWVEALDMLTADLSENARRKLWAENARRVYRLGDG
ncbi:MAG TPA: amidohydrolase family protein [Roseiflexaceae bacterium]|nr:amidohydrolase family protein [Roseiflexaceae bacterium]